MSSKNSIIIVILAFLYFILGKFSFYISFANKIVVSSIFFPEGISLVFAAIYGRKAVLGVFIGQFLLAITSGLDFFSSLGIGIVNSLEYLIASYIFEKFSFKGFLKNTKDLSFLFILIFFILQPFSALFGNLILLLSSVITKKEFISSFSSWYIGNAVAQSLIAPMVFYFRYYEKTLSISKLFVSTFLGLMLGYILFFHFNINHLTILLGITLIFSLFIANLWKLFYAGIFLLFLYITALLSIKTGNSFFLKYSYLENILNLDFYFLSHIFIIYTLALLITEKDIYAKELENVNKTLEDRIKKALEENKKQQEYLIKQARFAQIGEIVSVIAHQWVQPLNIISATVQATYLKLKKKYSDEKLLDICNEKTREQINFMTKTLKDFMNYFRPEAKKQFFTFNSIIEKLEKIAVPALKEKGIELDITLCRDRYLLGYPNELIQVLLNLINNAKEAFEEKNYEKTKKFIKIFSYKTDNKCLIIVEDNAGGIPEHIKEKIFEPYFSTKGNVGFGLGLYISKLLIENHMDGKIYVENTGEGARFVIELPLGDEEEGEYEKRESANNRRFQVNE